MNVRQSPYGSNSLAWGAIQIAGLYLLIGGLWILFSDQIAARVALSQEMLTTISLYKGWGYVIVTALLLYWLIQRHTAALLASKRQLQQVIDAFPALISYIDADRHYQFANNAYEEWFEEKVQGKPIEDVLGITAYKAISKYIDKVLAGETVNYETIIPYLQGERLVNATYIPDIEANGRVKGFFALVQDVTEHKQAEEERRFWADAFEGCAHGIAIGDPGTNRIVVCNPAFARLHQSRVEDIIGSAILSLYAPSDHEHVRRGIEKADQIGHSRYEANMVRNDGSVFPVQMDIVSVLGEDGELLHRVATAQDISERRQAEEKVLQQARLLEQVHDAVLAADKNFVLIAWNSAAERIYGWKAEEVIGRPVEEFLQTGFFSKTRSQAVQEIQEKGEFSAEVTQLRKDGARINIEARTTALQNESGEITGYVSVNRDITKRKQAESALRASQEQLLSLIRQAPVSIAMFDREMRYIATSQRWIAEYGRGYDDLAGKLHYEVHPDIPPQWKEAHQKGLAGETLKNDDDVWIRVDGTRNWLRWAIVPWYDAQGEIGGIIISSEDISERKQAEQNLRRFELLSEHSRDIILFLGREDGRILEANAAALQAYGYSRAELLALTIRDLRASDTHDLTADQMAQADVGGVLFETIHQRKDGATFPVEVSSQGTIISGVRTLISIVRDITERKKTETALMENITQFRTLFEASPDAILLIDPHDNWPILDCNTAACQMNGYTCDELIGQPIDILNAQPLPHVTLDKYLADIRQAGVLRYEALHRRKDGTEFPIEVSTTLISLGGRDVLLGIDRDITERVQAQNTIRLKDELLHLTSEMAKVGGWEFDTQTLQGTWTDEVARIHDLEPSQETNVAIGLSFYTGWAREKIDQALKDAMELGKPYDLELEMVSAKGNHKWVRTAALPIVNDDQVIKLQGIFQDITERKQAEMALRESEQKFSVIYYKAPFAAALSSLPNGVIVDVNEAFERVFGYTRQEATGKTSQELGINPDSEGRARITAELQAQGSVHDLELTLLTKSGIARVFLMNLDLVGIGGVKYIFQTAEDITERKQIEKALQAAHDELELKVQQRTAALSEANALLQALMDNMPDHIYFKDTHSRFIRNSKSQADLLGLGDPAEVIGKTDFDFFPHAAKSYAEEQEVMRSGKPLVDFEEWVVWPDGRETWVSTTKLPLRNADGQTIGIFGISHDITERKRAEQAIQQLNMDLEAQAARLQAANKELEAFSYSVSHDLRAPLRAIDGYTRILVEDYEPILGTEGGRLCGIIGKEARRMGQLIDDLLAFSRLGRKEIYSSKIDMKALALSVFNELTKEEERERIDFQISKLPSAKGDASMIRQVWTNLLANALKFTSKRERAVIEVGSRQSTDENIYYVRDTGAGFDMEYANKLFGVFQRLHGESEFEGTGVGLAIVQRIIHRHGGRVWAEGEVDKGATFTFALPRKENQHE